MATLTGEKGTRAELYFAITTAVAQVIEQAPAEMPKGVSVNIPRLGKPYSQAQLASKIPRLLPNAPDRPA